MLAEAGQDTAEEAAAASGADVGEGAGGGVADAGGGGVDGLPVYPSGYTYYDERCVLFVACIAVFYV